MNVRYRVELSQAERDELSTMLSGGKHAVRSEPRFCWRRMLAAATRRLPESPTQWSTQCRPSRLNAPRLG